MATNQFDQYFGAEYVPQYTPLPIGELAQGLQYRQGKHEKNLVEMDQLEDLWANEKFLPQDEERGRSRLENYRKQFNQFATEGDYSQAAPFIRRIARAYMDDKTSGYLGATQQSYQNYLSGLKQIEESNRTATDKELAKRNWFNRYQGIDPDAGDLFSQVYKTDAIPEYVDIFKEAQNIAKDIKPTKDIQSESPWFQSPDGLRWLQNSGSIEELPAEVIAQVTKNALLRNPKLKESLVFEASLRGLSPDEYGNQILDEAATSVGDIYKYKKTTSKQNQQFPPEWQFDLRNTAITQRDLESMEYEDKTYYDIFDKIKTANSGTDFIITKSNKSPVEGAVLITQGGYGNDVDYHWSIPKENSEKVIIPEEYKGIYDSVAKNLKGKTDKETYNNVMNWVKNVKEKGLSTKLNPYSVKQSKEETDFLQRNFLSRKFVDPETGSIYLGSDILKDKDGILKKAVKEVKGKDEKSILDNLVVLGESSVDNPYLDITGQYDFARPIVARIGSKRFIVSQPAGYLESTEGIADAISNIATRPVRSGIEINVGEELKKIKVPSSVYKGYEDVKVVPNEDGTYKVFNIYRKNRELTVDADNIDIAVQKVK